MRTDPVAGRGRPPEGRRVHCLRHVHFEGPGIIETWVLKRARSISETRFYLEEELPALEGVDWLIVMGGPMSAGDEDRHPWLTREKRYIEQAIEKGKTVLGICLGAQLVADVLGARVYPSGHKEIGWFPITPTEAARHSRAFSFLKDPLTVFHWHGDTFDLPRGAVRIAESEACLNQAYALGTDVIGLQFHLEVSRNGVEALIANCSADIVPGRYVQSAQEILSGDRHFERIHDAMMRILDNLAGPAAIAARRNEQLALPRSRITRSGRKPVS